MAQENIGDIQELTDEELIHRILGGKQRLFEEIVRRYNARLHRIGMALLGDEADVMDAMQLAYIKAYEHLKDFEGKAQFGTWLTRIFINESNLYLKRKKKQAMRQLEAERKDKVTAGEVPNPAVNNELKKLLEDALATLPEKYRLVFVMREIEDMSTAETMAVLGLTESTVKTRLSRAKAMLRDKLSIYYKNDLVYHLPLNECDGMVQRVFERLQINPG